MDDRTIYGIERPSRKLMQYYAICCLLTGPLFPIVILPYYFRYYTMRYRFGEEGVSMRWGILFRKEIILNYSRIQDIHLTSNVVERWLGLARLQIQTASGSASAEMIIEGLEEYEMVRDFLYARMRGQRESSGGSGTHVPARGGGVEISEPALAELANSLRETAAELRTIRVQLERGDGGRGGASNE